MVHRTTAGQAHLYSTPESAHARGGQTKWDSGAMSPCSLHSTPGGSMASLIHNCSIKVPSEVESRGPTYPGQSFPGRARHKMNTKMQKI